jgi:hypothetical protein
LTIALIADLAADYQHPNPADLSRVQRAHSLDNDSQAKRWLMDRAVTVLRRQVAFIAPTGNGYGRYRPCRLMTCGTKASRSCARRKASRTSCLMRLPDHSPGDPRE